MFNHYAADYLQEYGNEMEEKGRKIGIAEGRAEGREKGRAEGILQNCSEMVQKYISKNGVSVEEAMDSLSVDEAQRPVVRKMLQL